MTCDKLKHISDKWNSKRHRLLSHRKKIEWNPKDWIEKGYTRNPHREIDSESCLNKPNLECNFTNLVLNGIEFGAKNNRKSVI